MQQRDALFDNTKAFLIYLVVQVHLMAAVGRVTDVSPTKVDLFMLFACAFHMPLFMFITGYFSKRLERGLAKVQYLAVVYFLVQILLAIYYVTVLHMSRTLVDLIAPGFSMWYLAITIILKWIQPSLIKIPHLLGWLALLSVLSCWADPEEYSEKTLVKVCAFAFFYMLGYYANKDHIARLREIPKWVAALVFAGCCGLLYGLTRGAEPQIISLSLLRNLSLHNKYLEDMNMGIAGLGWAIFVLAIAIVMGGAVLILMPQKKLWISHLGANTLPIYMAQVFVYKIYKELVRTPYLSEHAMVAYGITIPLTIATVLFFGSDWFAGWFTRITKRLEQFVFRTRKLAPKSM